MAVTSECFSQCLGLPVQLKNICQWPLIKKVQITVFTSSLIGCCCYNECTWKKCYRHCFCTTERFSNDLEVKTHEQNRNNQWTEIERFDWFIERIQTQVVFGWLSERSCEKTSCPRISRHQSIRCALTSYCNTIGQSNNAFSILGFSLAGKQKALVLVFSSTGC